MAKYKVTKKPLTPNTIWDAEAGKPLCRFDKGVILTDDKALVTKLKALGHTVTENADAEQAEAEKPDADDNGDDVGDDSKDEADQGDGADAEQAEVKPSTGRRSRSKSGK